MTRRYSWEERIALAMLPLGATMAIVSALACVAALALLTATAAGLYDWRFALWSALAAPLAAFNARRSIETLSSFAWQRFVPVPPLSAGLLATFPGWW